MKTDQGAQGHEGAFQGHMPLRGTGAFPFIGNAPCDAPAPRKKGHGEKASPVLPPHNLDHPGVTKILLSEAATAALEAVGPHCLIVTSKADATAPAHAQGRAVLLCYPITRQLADDAYRVAGGTHRAVRIRKPSTSKP